MKRAFRADEVTWQMQKDVRSRQDSFDAVPDARPLVAILAMSRNRQDVLAVKSRPYRIFSQASIFLLLHNVHEIFYSSHVYRFPLFCQKGSRRFRTGICIIEPASGATWILTITSAEVGKEFALRITMQ
jgi:hypothetical protein